MRHDPIIKNVWTLRLCLVSEMRHDPIINSVRLVPVPSRGRKGETLDEKEWNPYHLNNSNNKTYTIPFHPFFTNPIPNMTDIFNTVICFLNCPPTL